MTYEQHLKSIEQGQDAKANLRATEDLLKKAEEANQKVLSNYRDILERGKAEDNVELRQEAFAEYKQFLQTEAAKATQAEDYEYASRIYKNLAALKEEYDKNIPSWSAPENPTLKEALIEVENLLQKRGVTDKAAREHALNRTRRKVEDGYPTDQILKIIERDLDQKPYTMAAAPWTGFSGK